MERLTFTDEEMKKIDDDFDCPVKNDYHIDRFCDNVCDEFQYNCPFKELGKKLKTYEDKEEQGLLIELPCKILDALYINDFRCDYHMNFDRPYAVKVWTIVINGRNDFIDVMLEDGTMYQFYLSDIGKTIFLTKAEAEEALARMEGE